MGNALLEAPKVAVTFRHRLNGPESNLRPMERECFFPSPMFDVAVGEGKIGATLVASVGKRTPVTAGRGTSESHNEVPPCHALWMFVDEHKRLGWTGILNARLIADDEFGGGPGGGGSCVSGPAHVCVPCVMPGARRFPRVASRGSVGRPTIGPVGAQGGEQDTTLDIRAGRIREGVARRP